MGAYEEKLVSQEIERQFSEYWCKVSGLPVGVDPPAVVRLVRSLHRESEIPVHKVIKRVEFNIHYVMIKVPTRWQRDLLISLLNGRATNKGTTITAVEWIYTFDAAAIFHEMEKILKKDLDRRTALEAQKTGERHPPIATAPGKWPILFPFWVAVRFLPFLRLFPKRGNSQGR